MDMEYIKIDVPDMNDSVSRVVLDNVQYNLRFYWNDTMNYWSLDILDHLLQPIIRGIKVVPQFPLNLLYTAIAGMPGGMFVVLTDEERVKRYDFVEDKAKFVYFPKEQILSTER